MIIVSRVLWKKLKEIDNTDPLKRNDAQIIINENVLREIGLKILNLGKSLLETQMKNVTNRMIERIKEI